jgi:hypothetical protein
VNKIYIRGSFDKKRNKKDDGKIMGELCKELKVLGIMACSSSSETVVQIPPEVS